MTTEVTRADQLLQKTLLGEGFDNLDAAVFVADEHGRYVAVNRMACEMTGYSREELLGLDVRTVAKDISDYKHAIEGSKHAGSVALVRKDGSEVEVDWGSGSTRIAGMPFYVGICWSKS